MRANLNEAWISTRLLQDFGFSLIRKWSYLGISLGSKLLTLDTSVVSSRSRSVLVHFGRPSLTPRYSLFLSQRRSASLMQERDGDFSLFLIYIRVREHISTSTVQIGRADRPSHQRLLCDLNFGRIQKVSWKAYGTAVNRNSSLFVSSRAWDMKMERAGRRPPVDFSVRLFSLRLLSSSWLAGVSTFGKRKKETNVEQESRTRAEPMRKTRETW